MHQMFIYLAIAREEYGQENFPNRSGNDCSKDKSLTGRVNLILQSIVIITISGHQIPINPIFTARKKVCEVYVFTPVCQSFCSHRGGGEVPGQVPPGRYTAPLPPGRSTPPPPGRYAPQQIQPPWQVHTPSRYTPTPCQVHLLAGTHPLSSACWDTVNKRAVRIPMECILVSKVSMHCY